MDQATIVEATELLLRATFPYGQGDGRRMQFMFVGVASALSAPQGGASISMGKIELLKTALFIRRHGPNYLRSLSIHEIEGRLSNFLTDNYAILANETWFADFSGSFYENISAETKEQLTAALGNSELISPISYPTVFPLCTVDVQSDFEGSSFFLIKPDSLRREILGDDVDVRDIRSKNFPPYEDKNIKPKYPLSWLGVRSPTLFTSKKIRSSVLGSIALLPHQKERYLFTGRTLFGGSATLKQGRWTWNVAFDGAHTPRISEDIRIDGDDHSWLEILDEKLSSDTIEDANAIKALEYFYRAWFLPEVERFPIFFQAIDAIFGDISGATQSAMDGLATIAGTEFDTPRLKLLLKLRGAVIHGGAPDIYDSSKYFKYYEKHGADPIDDLEVLTARAIRTVVFGNKLVERPHTYAALAKSALGIDI